MTIPQEALFRPEFTCVNGIAEGVAALLADAQASAKPS